MNWPLFRKESQKIKKKAPFLGVLGEKYMIIIVDGGDYFFEYEERKG